MNYQFQPGEELDAGIRRIARKQVARARALLGKDTTSNGGKAIHAARKWLKKIRALLRLVRPALDRADYRRQDRRFKVAARALARQRDAQVLRSTLDKLCGEPRARPGSQILAKLKGRLVERQTNALPDNRDETRRCRAGLQAAGRKLDAWLPESVRWADLARGLRGSYRRGLRAFEDAKRTRSSAALHEWRKRVKDCWYELRLIQPARPKPLGRMAKQLKQLSVLLGDDHDLAMLTDAARDARLDLREREYIDGLIHERRKRLQSAALRLGRRVYREKPSMFALRIKGYGKRWMRR